MTTKKRQRAARKSEADCWAVFFTRMWGNPCKLQQSIPLTKREARAQMARLRKMERSYSMGRKFRIFKLPNKEISIPVQRGELNRGSS